MKHYQSCNTGKYDTPIMTGKKIKYNPEQTQFLELVDKEMNRVVINTVDP